MRIDRGGRANSINFAMMDALTDAARSFENDTELAAVILAGSKTLFSGGMDLKDAAFDRLAEMSLAEQRALAKHGPRMARA